MIVYKCKMCNGNLDMSEHKRLVKCNYCDTYQSVPSLLDENKAEMVNRANRYRQNGEFDRATSIYEQILREDATDPEIHWSIVLCKFGVEYVEDPATGHMIPTVNRTQSHSILQDPDYQNALIISEADAKQYYITEADKIDKIQRSIWRIAQDSENYDVFISYKEKGPDGNRTETSMIAERLYEGFTAAGIKTFFSRVSLADKLGNEFEPYIFSALNSANVMLVLGTQKEEFNAPWVKNEWSRFSKLAMKDSHKRLIPCVWNVNIEDLPDDLQPYQAQDMNRDGAEQDLLEAVTNLVSKLKASASVLNETDAEKLMKNGETYILLKDFGTAEMIFRDLCTREPEDYRVWWGRIRSVTEDLNNEDALKKHSQDLKIWMDFIKKLAPAEKHTELSEKYISYLKKVARQNVLEEIETVKKIKEQTIEKAKNLQIEMQKPPAEKSISEQNLEKLCKELEEPLMTAMRAKPALQEKYTRYNNCAIAFMGLTIAAGSVCYFGYQFTNMTIFLVTMFLLVLFGGITYFFYGRYTTVEAQIVKNDLIVETNQEKLDKAKNNLELINSNIVKKKENAEISIQKYKEIVENADRYLTYETDSICDLLHAILCSEIGVDKPMDQKLFEIRQSTFQEVE